MFPPLGAVIDELVAPDWAVKTNPFLLPSDLADINMYAGWNRPEMYLDADYRRAMSGFALADPAIVEPALKRLAEDLESGAWDRANGALRQRDSFDAGYRFIRWTAPLR